MHYGSSGAKEEKYWYHCWLVDVERESDRVLIQLPIGRRCVINDANLLIFPGAHTVCLVPRLDTSRITITISPSYEEGGGEDLYLKLINNNNKNNNHHKQ